MSRHLIRERYELLETLGVGGEGRVVKALDHQHQRFVALKIRPVHDDAAREDLLGEARTLLAIPPHNGLPLVREDFFDGGSYFLAMDWVDGTDLGTLLLERGRPGLAPSSVLAYLAQVAEALTHLHSLEPPVIHGDIKPANLILTKGGRVQLVDFGLSSAPNAIRRLSGTVGYRAPELATGGMPSSASDVYSLAATAFALLTGAAPAGVLPSWDGIDPAQAAQLESAIRSGLATDPQRRPATSGELVELLRSGWGEALPTGVVTFLLSDIERSTALWDGNPAAMAEALVRHDELIADHAEAHGGRFLKSKGEGDSTFSVFDSAPAALEAAVAVNHALAVEQWPAGLHIAVRFGLHTGDAQRRSADYFGPTVNLAARVRGQADGQQIFLSSATAALVAGQLPKGCELVDLGPYRLRGVGAPERIHAVRGPDLSTPLPVGECPYRGLLAFEPGDSAFFFGREEVAADIIGRLGSRRLLAVVGASGSGKSSVLRAGVVAAVLAGEVTGIAGATIVTPGADARPVVPDASDQLVVVDQFEELYTLCDDRARRDAFIDGLLSLGSPVVIAVRADMYGQLSGHAELARAVAGNQVLLGAMSGSELERAVIEPARLAGLRLETGLVELILRDVAGEPGALPLLSHALRVTWEHRDGRTMTIEAYRESGGVASAIAQTADAVVESVPADQHGLMRNLFLRLTELGDGIEDSRRRVRIDELVPEDSTREKVEALLDRLAETRLITLGEGTAEVAHEVLIREWPTLRHWLEEDREGIRLHRSIGNAAQLWDAGDRDAGDLYRGTRLAAATEWAERHPDSLNAGERDFLDASVASSRGEAERQTRVNRRLKVLLAGVLAMLVLAVVAGLFAVSQRSTARDAARKEAAQRLGAEALTVDRLDEALKRANAGNALDDSPATRSNLLRVLLRGPGAIGVLNGDGDEIAGIATSPDESMVAIEDVGGDVTVFDVATRTRLARYKAQVEIGGLQFSPASDRLAIIGADLRGSRREGRLQVIDPRSGELVASAPIPLPAPDYLVGGSFAADGKTIAVIEFSYESDTPVNLRRFDAISGSAIGRGRRVPGMVGAFTSLPATPDGRLLYVGDHATIAVDDTTLRVVRRYESGARDGIAAVGGMTLALLGERGEIRLLDLQSGQSRTMRGRQSDRAFSLAISPDGKTLATSDESAGVTIWDVASGRQLEILEGQEGEVYTLHLGEGGRTLYGAGRGTGAIVWDVTGARRLGAIFPTGLVAIPEDYFPPAFSVSPSGNELAVARLDGKIDLIDAETLRTRRTIEAFDRTPATAIEYSPSGRLLAVAGMRGMLGLFDATTGERVGDYVSSPNGPCADPASNFGIRRCLERTIQVLTFVAEDRLVAASIGGVLRNWDLEGREVVGPPVRLPKFVTGLASSPDGSTIAVTYGYVNAATGVAIIDAGNGERVADLTTPGQPRSVAFSPDGRTLAVGQTTGDVLFWETESWQGTDLAVTHGGLILGVQFSPDGRTLATSNDEGTIALWDATSGTQIGSVLPPVPNRVGPPGPPWNTSRFTPDGSRLFAVYDTGNAVRWELDPEAWRRHACSVAGGGLTREEWEEIVPDQEYRATCD